MTPEQKLRAITMLAGIYSLAIEQELIVHQGDISKISSEIRAVGYILSEIMEIINPEATARADADIATIDRTDPKEVMNALVRNRRG